MDAGWHELAYDGERALPRAGEQPFRRVDVEIVREIEHVDDERGVEVSAGETQVEIAEGNRMREGRRCGHEHDGQHPSQPEPIHRGQWYRT